MLTSAVLMSAFPVSFAAGVETVSLSANINGKMLSVRGSIDNGLSDNQISLTITDPKGMLLYMDQIICGEDGQYKKTLTLDDTAPLGDYTVTVGGKAVDEAATAVVAYNNDPYVSGYNWDSDCVYQRSDGLAMNFRPKDKYASQQNPPSFTWPFVEGADSFELKICSDEALSDIKYHWDGLKINVFTPDCLLETGVQYYWSVRYFIDDGQSEWSEARRFRIDTNAYEAVMEDIDTIMSRIPSSHPRVFTRPEKLEEFRKLKETNEYSKLVYEKYLAEAQGYVLANKLYDDPNEEDAGIDESASDAYQSIQYTNYINKASEKMTDQLMACSFIYLLTEDAAIGAYAKTVLLKLAGWDPAGSTSAEKATQANRLIAICMARAYDWIYGLLDADTEIPTVLSVIKQRTDPISIYPEYNRKMPYGSHEGTRFMYAGIVAYATYGEIEGYDKLLRDTIEAFSYIPAWSYEDGGWAQGTGYYNSRLIDKDFVDLLALGGVVNFYDRAWFQNEYLYTTYAWPIGSYGGFGEGAGRKKSESNSQVTAGMKRTAYFTGNSYAKWYAENAKGMGSVNDFSDYYANMSDSVASMSPKDLPLSHEFRDIGVAVMTSSLEDSDRVQLTFRSSPYGTYSHSFSDNNGFLISAFGENLAIHSGYYDAFGSPHEQNIHRQTFANNSITTDGGAGQKLNSFNAEGSIKAFVNHIDFDSVTGDATQAYNGKLDKFERSIIYVRPDVFVVIDDLKAKAGSTSVFEWWLNGENAIEIPENAENSAVIKQGTARLKAQVQYPETVIREYYDGFTAPNGTYYPAEGSYADYPEHKRVSFATEKCSAAKMVVTMDVYNEGETAAKEITPTYSDDGSYMKLSFEDGTEVFVNLKGESDTVVAENIEFSGTAVALNSYSVMLTNGTYLEVDGNVLINSDEAVTVAMGNSQLALSCDDDCDISLNAANKYLTVGNVSDLKDEKGRKISGAIGLNASLDGETLELSAEGGNYILLSNSGILSANSIIPQNIAVNKTSDAMAQVSWNEVSGCSYNVTVNDTVYQNVSAPLSFEVSQAEAQYKITVTAIKNNIIKSGTVYYTAGAVDFYSYVKYSGIGRVTANAFVNNANGKNVSMLVCSYDSEGRLASVEEAAGNAKLLKASVNLPDNGLIKTFIWDKASGKPLTQASVYNSNSTALKGIFLDGELISDFDDSKSEYNAEISQYSVYPTVTAVAADNSTKVVVNTDCSSRKTTITLTAQVGSTRTVTINYNVNAKAYVTNITQSVREYSGLSSGLKEGCTDTSSKRYISSPKLKYNFGEGAVAYGDRDYPVVYLNDLAELEGCCYLPPNMSMNYAAYGSDAESSVAWQNAYYYGLGSEKGYKYPAFSGKSFDLYSFNLNTTANLYVVTYGNTPEFIDDTWKKLKLGTVFIVERPTGRYAYDDIYMKTVSVPEGKSVKVTMKTPGTRDINDGQYYLLVKPVSK